MNVAGLVCSACLSESTNIKENVAVQSRRQQSFYSEQALTRQLAQLQGEPFGEAEEAALKLLMWEVPVREDTLTHVLLMGLTNAPLLPGQIL